LLAHLHKIATKLVGRKGASGFEELVIKFPLFVFKDFEFDGEPTNLF